MKRITMLLLALATVFLLSWAVVPASFSADRVLRYSSSAQVDEAFGLEVITAFSRTTGIKVEKYVSSSDSALSRLMNGFSDIASTVERLPFMSKDYGYIETPFCIAPLLVITNVKTTVDNITESQLRLIFSGEIVNWSELGGPDEPIIVVVPGKDTGAFKNFRQLALKQYDVRYDFMSYKSTMVTQVVKRLPWTISFITIGAHTADAAIKTININGLSPKDKRYPYYQTFSFVTKGKPSGEANELIDFTFSEEGRKIMKKYGIKPLLR